MVPDDRKYTQEHEWVQVEGDIGTVGVTDHAAGELGDIVFVELPETGSEFSAGDSVGTIESVKAVADLYLPVAARSSRSTTPWSTAPSCWATRPVRRRLAGQGPPGRAGASWTTLLDAERLRGSAGRLSPAMAYMPHTPEDIRAMLATIGAASIDELFASLPADGAPAPPAGHPRRPQRGGGAPSFQDAGRAQPQPGGPGVLPGRRRLRQHHPRRLDAISSRSEFLTAYTPYQAEVSPGHAAGHLRVADLHHAA